MCRKYSHDEFTAENVMSVLRTVHCQRDEAREVTDIEPSRWCLPFRQTGSIRCSTAFEFQRSLVVWVTPGTSRVLYSIQVQQRDMHRPDSQESLPVVRCHATCDWSPAKAAPSRWIMSDFEILHRRKILELRYTTPAS